LTAFYRRRLEEGTNDLPTRGSSALASIQVEDYDGASTKCYIVRAQ